MQDNMENVNSDSVIEGIEMAEVYTRRDLFTEDEMVYIVRGYQLEKDTKGRMLTYEKRKKPYKPSGIRDPHVRYKVAVIKAKYALMMDKVTQEQHDEYVRMVRVKYEAEQLNKKGKKFDLNEFKKMYAIAKEIECMHNEQQVETNGV